MNARCIRAGLLLAVTAPGPAHAVSVQTWSVSSAAEFARGTLEGTAVDEDGRVRPAPPFDTLWGPEAGVVWAVAPAGRDGAFVALSGPGRLLRVATGRPAEVWYQPADEVLVTALALDGGEGAVFGVAPAGLVLRAPRAGEAETLAETGAAFIWALTRQEDGTLWIGTGLPGRLLRLRPGEPLQTVFEAGGDDAVRSIALLPGGGVAFGTGGRGRVVRIGPDRRPFVLLDAEEAEIVALAVADSGSIYALAARGPIQPGASAELPGGEPAPSASTTIRVVAAPPPDEPGEEPLGEPAPPRAASPPPQQQRFKSPPGGSLYRIDPDGSTRRIWETRDEMPFALVAAGDDRLLVGTGDGGRIVQLDFEGRATRLLRSASNQASSLSRDEQGNILVGGTTDARVERIGKGVRASAAYLSPVVDAGSVADWGRLRFEADRPRGTGLRFQARSGNSSDPDATWSDWVELGQADPAGLETKAPAARWLQVRAELLSDGAVSPVLRRIEVLYLPHNRSPRIESLTVEPTGVVWVPGPVQTGSRLGPFVTEDPVSRRISAGLQRGARAGVQVRRTYEAGTRTFAWQAADPDDDRLAFALEIRREDQGAWFALTRDLEEQFYSWDARGAPDGVYRARLSVSDSADNPNGTGRRAERISEAFTVDNSRPSVGGFNLVRSRDTERIEFTARDPAGSVAAVEVGLDGSAWQPLYPLDGVADAEEERFVWDLVGGDAQRREPRTLRVRVTDAAGNVGGDLWPIPAGGDQ